MCEHIILEDYITEKYIYDNNNGLWYELQGDYYIPCLYLCRIVCYNGIKGAIQMTLQEKFDGIVDCIEKLVYAGENDIPQVLARETGFNLRLLGDAFQFVADMTLIKYIRQAGHDCFRAV